MQDDKPLNFQVTLKNYDNHLTVNCRRIEFRIIVDITHQQVSLQMKFESNTRCICNYTMVKSG